jgi:hypothetical protein
VLAVIIKKGCLPRYSISLSPVGNGFRNDNRNWLSTIHLYQTITLTPEQYIVGLTDFGPGRSKLFGNSTDEYLKVHRQTTTEADVTEGSSGIWERLHYDWSDPNRVVLKTTDSNLWGGASATPTLSPGSPTARPASMS